MPVSSSGAEYSSMIHEVKNMLAKQQNESDDEAYYEVVGSAAIEA